MYSDGITGQYAMMNPLVHLFSAGGSINYGNTHPNPYHNGPTGGNMPYNPTAGAHRSVKYRVSAPPAAQNANKNNANAPAVNNRERKEAPTVFESRGGRIGVCLRL